MIQTDQKYSYGPRSTLYRPGSTLYWPGSTLYSPWSFPDVPRSTQYCPGSTLYSPCSFPDVPNIVPEGFFWLDGGGLGSFTSLTNLMRGVYKRRALAPCDFLRVNFLWGILKLCWQDFEGFWPPPSFVDRLIS